MAIFRGTGSTGTGGESDFAQLAQDAEAAAAAAEIAQLAAELAENNAETAETNAETAATNAASSASAASTSASSAASSASTATAQASNAATSATNAANSATAASNSASAASTSATNAASSATSAAGSATTATTQATNAASSATAAATSASSASTSATNASNSASAASTSATNASNSATAASNSATSAATSATNSANSATAAASSAAEAAATLSSNVSKSGDTMTGPLIVNANTSTDAFRITQTGTGNALVVEDSANPDATPFVVTTNGVVISGATSTATVGSGTGRIQAHGVSSTATNNGMLSGAWANSAVQPYYSFVKSRGTSVGDYTVVQSGDRLGTIGFYGSDGSATVLGAIVQAEVDGTPGTNDMPGRLVLSTTRDGASSPTEAMRIDSKQSVGIGAAPTGNVSLLVGKNITGAVASRSIRTSATVQSDVTANAYGYESILGTQATAFTLGNLTHYYAEQGTIGAGSAVTNQYGFQVYSNLTGATNNYGFYSSIASGTGRYNFYAAGSADNYFAGAVGIGGGTTSATTLVVGKNLTSATTVYSILSQPQIQSDVTSNAYTFYAGTNTAASSFTLGNAVCFNAAQANIGAGSSITNQIGFRADSSLTGATNNYGFYSNIASGTGRYNFYAAGSADNYFAGKVGIGVTADEMLSVSVANPSDGRIASLRNSGASSLTGTKLRFLQNTVGNWNIGMSAGEDAFVFCNSTGSTNERARIDSAGIALIGLTSATGVAKLQVSGPIKTTGYTVATLPAGTVGMRTYVTDAMVPVALATVAGGGSSVVPVFYNGTNWIVA